MTHIDMKVDLYMNRNFSFQLTARRPVRAIEYLIYHAFNFAGAFALISISHTVVTGLILGFYLSF